METKTEQTAPADVEFVYGLDGICSLFGVCKDTAMKYKKSFLAPAVMQKGRKIVVDKAKALELFAKAN